ncbi:ISL3 family transposase, partial [Vagococcus elongatus]
MSSSHQPTFIQLKKQRFFCRDCQTTFVAASPEVDAGCFIANRVKQSIAIELQDNLSMEDLARRHGVSPTTTTRILVQRGNEHAPDFQHLPKNLCFDEFKSVKHVTNKMSFIFCDAATRKIIDILPNRLQKTLLDYFSRYSLKARAQVKTIVIDMNAAYFTVITELFPNTKITIDRFHIVQLMSRALNQTRVTFMKKLFGTDHEKMKDYRKLKRY